MVSKTDSGKMYRNECTGDALETVKSHTEDQDLTLFGSCFCPFVQRVWVSFEYLQIQYKVYEVDPYKKPKDLLEVSPKGLVPGLKLNNFHPPRALNESTVILEYINDLAVTSNGRSLLPPTTNPCNIIDARALVRLQCDHVNCSLVPSFYRYLQAQDQDSQINGGKEFHESIEGLVELLERTEKEKALAVGLGLWIPENEEDLGLVDVMAGPCKTHRRNAKFYLPLKQYRGFELPRGEKFNRWTSKLFDHPSFKRTCNTEGSYLDSYERYAFNRPNTSQVANAVNSGRGLP
ncbi:glutathione S-transferase [Lentinula novae-zelandiae]|nr:glutathione S-transferase [Lentinula novae-zelandiae]